MEKIILGILLLFGQFSNISAKEKEPILAYKIISDEFDKTIPIGKYVLEGKVYELNTKSVIKNVQIQTQNAEKFKAENGSFKLELIANEDWIIFEKEKFQATYFENYKVKSQHRIKIEIYMEKEGKRKEIPCEKPVIYVYNNSPIDFSIELKPTGNLFFTYPQLPANNIWKMKTTENNLISDNNGKSYPYLFWEAIQSENPKLLVGKEAILGQFISKEKSTEFLDSCLTLLNLNEREKTDFITYWGPRLMKNKYNFIQFVVQDQANQFATYEIVPKPNSFNRIYLLFSGFETLPQELLIQKQELIPFSRSGFDILEWGGIEFDSAILNQTEL
jgi:hypothetical protein